MHDSMYYQDNEVNDYRTSPMQFKSYTHFKWLLLICARVCGNRDLGKTYYEDPYFRVVLILL